MKLTKKEIQAIEKLGWSVEQDEDGYILENYSPCGGDMVIDGVKTKEEIIDYCNGFDPEEEFDCWYGAKNGEPTSPGELWEDCLAKEEMYQALKELLDK